MLRGSDRCSHALYTAIRIQTHAGNIILGRGDPFTHSSAKNFALASRAWLFFLCAHSLHLQFLVRWLRGLVSRFRPARYLFLDTVTGCEYIFWKEEGDRRKRIYIHNYHIFLIDIRFSQYTRNRTLFSPAFVSFAVLKTFSALVFFVGECCHSIPKTTSKLPSFNITCSLNLTHLNARAPLKHIPPIYPQPFKPQTPKERVLAHWLERWTKGKTRSWGRRVGMRWVKKVGAYCLWPVANLQSPTPLENCL